MSLTTLDPARIFDVYLRTQSSSFGDQPTSIEVLKEVLSSFPGLWFRRGTSYHESARVAANMVAETKLLLMNEVAARR